LRAIPSSFFINMVTNQWRHLADHELSGIEMARIFECTSNEYPDVMVCMRHRPRRSELAATWWDTRGRRATPGSSTGNGSPGR
jgi:hypothetical protein